jgi:pyruvate/2-oxoglutarate/acetoin dehydrogenase E1 component
MGGRRGYGPTHSQTLEKYFLGLPGLKVVAPCDLQMGKWQMDAGRLLLSAIADDDPVLFIENKLLYLSRLHTPQTLPDFELRIHAGDEGISCYPTYLLSIQGAPPANLTLVAYGHMAGLAREAALELAYQHEIFVELIVPTLLSPFAAAMWSVVDSLRRTGRLLVVEEGTLTLGWGTEILARAAEVLGPHLKVARRVAALEVPIPAASALEAAVLPNLQVLVTAARKMV